MIVVVAFVFRHRPYPRPHYRHPLVGCCVNWGDGHQHCHHQRMVVVLVVIVLSRPHHHRPPPRTRRRRRP